MSENRSVPVIAVQASFGEIVAGAFVFIEGDSWSKVETFHIDCKSRNGFFDQCHAILEAQKIAEKDSGSVVDIVILNSNDSVFSSNVYKFLDHSTHNVRMDSPKPYNHSRFSSSLAHRAIQFQDRFNVDCKINMKPDGRWTVLDIADDTHLAIVAWSNAYLQLIAKEDSGV